MLGFWHNNDDGDDGDDGVMMISIFLSSLTVVIAMSESP